MALKETVTLKADEMPALIKLNSRKEVILLMPIKSGLCDVIQPINGWPPQRSILCDTEICNYFFSFNFDVVYGRLYGLIWVSISDSFVFNVGDPLNIEWELR